MHQDVMLLRDATTGGNSKPIAKPEVRNVSCGASKRGTEASEISQASWCEAQLHISMKPFTSSSGQTLHSEALTQTHCHWGFALQAKEKLPK